MKKLDDHKKNFVISLSVCCGSMLVLLVILNLTWIPYELEQREKYLTENNCNIGQENEGACLLEPSIVAQGIVFVPVIIFLLVMNKLEKKRNHTWRSYH
jgi:hypothetical protein